MSNLNEVVSKYNKNNLEVNEEIKRDLQSLSLKDQSKFAIYTSNCNKSTIGQSRFASAKHLL